MKWILIFQFIQTIKEKLLSKIPMTQEQNICVSYHNLKCSYMDILVAFPYIHTYILATVLLNKLLFLNPRFFFLNFREIYYSLDQQEIKLHNVTVVQWTWHSLFNSIVGYINLIVFFIWGSDFKKAALFLQTLSLLGQPLLTNRNGKELCIYNTNL